MTFGFILIDALSALAVFGVTTSTIYSLMVAVGVLRFRWRAAAAGSRRFQPPVSVLKPLHGDEPNLEENLASFFQQDYPEYEILFCARKSDDPGLETARRVAARFPRVPARILVCGEPPWPNARTYSLEIMRRSARFPILVATDSDVRVAPDYLASVVEPLDPPATAGDSELRIGRATLQLLGWEDKLNQPLDEQADADDRRNQRR